MEFNRSDIELAQCLRHLLRNRFILRRKSENNFQLLVDQLPRIDRALQTLGLKVQLHENLGVAHLATLSPELEDRIQYQIGLQKTLSPWATAILIFLRNKRHQYMINPDRHELPVATLEEVRQFLSPFSPFKVENQLERQLRGALKDLLEMDILIPLNTDVEAFEITALAELLLPLDQLQTLQQKLAAYFKTSRDNDALTSEVQS